MEYTLKRGGLTAVVTDQGGELISLRDAAGLEYIWQGDPASWTGRSPILFPIVGSLLDETIRIGGAPFHMKQHGFARRSAFTLEERGEDFAVLGLRESEATLAQYPFPFHFRVRHQLTEEGFSTSFAVENTGSEAMPFCVGAHTAFRCPLLEGERFEDYELLFEVSEQADSHLLNAQGIIRHDGRMPMLDGSRMPLRYQTFGELDTVIFSMLRSGGVSLLHRETGRGVQLDFHEFPMVAFWTKPEAPFLCLEPWQGCAAWDNESGKFEDKPFCTTLEPGRDKTLTYAFHIV